MRLDLQQPQLRLPAPLWPPVAQAENHNARNGIPPRRTMIGAAMMFPASETVELKVFQR